MTEPLAPKRFTGGTHRTTDPEDTLARLQPMLAQFGITRVANVTGLDTIGIPVVMVVRPNSRSLSVSQGKGLTLTAATVSGLMESIESHHGERVRQPLKLATYAELSARGRVVDVGRLVRMRTSTFTPSTPLLWVEGHDLLDGGPRSLPYETVHVDFRLPRPAGSGCFACTSNGLASGNHPLEALAHAICEVVERDAIALWSLGGAEAEARTRVDLSSVDDPSCAELIRRYDEAGVALAVWDITSDIGVPCFFAQIIDREVDPLRLLYAAAGSGCHPSRDVALLRALTEAAQSRLTAISGARDDILPAEYDVLRQLEVIEAERRLVVDGVPARRFTDAPTFESASFDDDVAWELDRLRAAGITEVVAVNLTDPAVGIPVMRVVVPGLEGPTEKQGDLVLMERAERVLAAGGSW